MVDNPIFEHNQDTDGCPVTALEQFKKDNPRHEIVSWTAVPGKMIGLIRPITPEDDLDNHLSPA